MAWGRKVANWNPLLWKSLLGIAGAGLLAFGVFHQPWIPVEITAADTGVLVAMPAPILSPESIAASQPVSRQQEPIDVPLAETAEEISPTFPAESPFVQTASITKPEPIAISPSPPPTYAEHIAPLLDRHCVACHQAGRSGLVLTQPFPVKAAAIRIAQATQDRRMPPWKPKPGFGHFQNERRLSVEEIDLIQKWANAGAPMGRSAENPKVIAKNEWLLGKPTVAYQLPQAFQIPESKGGFRWNFVIPTGVERDLYLTAAELRPGNAALVRRMILSYDPTGTARQKDEETPQSGFSTSQFERPVPSLVLAEWSHGMLAHRVPKGTAYRIPAGADLILIVEYADAPAGATDPWSMGLHLTRSAPEQLLGLIEVAVATPRSLETSADPDATQTEPARQEAAYQLPTDVTLHSISPKCFPSGKNLRVIAITPSGETVPLLEIENWEEDREERYYFREPVALPKGSRIMLQSWTQGTDSCRCTFEISTPQSEHLEPLMRHNQAAMFLH